MARRSRPLARALVLAATIAFAPARRARPPSRRWSDGGDEVDDLSPEELERYAKTAPTPEEEADLFAMLKDKFSEFEGSTYGDYKKEDLEEPLKPGSLESALRAEIGKLPKEEQVASDRRVLESIFDRGAEEFKETVEAMKEENAAIGKIAADELAADMAAEARAFETRMDDLTRAAGVDPSKLADAGLDDYDDDVLVTMDSAGGLKRRRAAPRPPAAAAPKAVEPVLVAGAGGDAALEAAGEVGTLVLVGASDAEAKRLVETHRPGRVVVLSAQGVTRAGEFAFLLRRGALEKAGATEGAAKLALAKLARGGEAVVVRAGAAAGAAGPAVVEVGDGLDAPTAPDLVAACLAKCCASPDVANATIAVSGAGACSDGRWRDLLLKARGPELARLDVDAPLDDVVLWAREWATLWRGDGAKRRLTTPVDVFADDAGADLLFDDKRAPKRAKAGGVLLRAERPTVDGAAATRLRAVRSDYSDGVAVKQMSEDEIILRLKADFEKTFG